MQVNDKCSRKKCGWIGKDDDKKSVPSKKQLAGLQVSDLVCPLCDCKSFYVLDNVITVKFSNNTYKARCNMKSASATSGPDQAANAVARKCWPDLDVKIAGKSKGDSWEFRVVSSMMHVPGGNNEPAT